VEAVADRQTPHLSAETAAISNGSQGSFRVAGPNIT
jgi:hypothetical protein